VEQRRIGAAHFALGNVMPAAVISAAPGSKSNKAVRCDSCLRAKRFRTISLYLNHCVKKLNITDQPTVFDGRRIDGIWPDSL
jgi:hypothetical protein